MSTTEDQSDMLTHALDKATWLEAWCQQEIERFKLQDCGTNARDVLVDYLCDPECKKQQDEDVIQIEDLSNPILDEKIGESLAEELREETTIIEEVYPELDLDAYLNGDQSPVFFGSAVNNFGVRELLDCFINIALRLG